MEQKKRRGIYIHIPFCVKKCNYCAFLSFPADGAPRKEYTDALVSEIRLRADAIRSEAAAKGKVPINESGDDVLLIDTLYVGGGTPSVLDISQMRDIMHAVKTSLRISPDAEITIEVNPGTLGAKDGVTRAKLRAYKSMGFNRLSMGVQSMDNDRLHFLGRIHTAENVARDVRMARELGFDNINLDLIFSIPGQSRQDAMEDLSRIIELKPEHISCYSLQIEEGTPFCDMINRGEISEVPDEEDRRTYHEICRMLRDAGYEHYEISNFARKSAESTDRTHSSDHGPAPGFGDGRAEENKVSPYRSRHNSLYWDMSDYIGCGLGASGFISGKRYRNISELEKYIRFYGEPDADDGAEGAVIVHEEEHINTPFDNISEAVFTGLRRREGITYEEAASAYFRNSDLKADRIIPREKDGHKTFFWDVFSEAKPGAKEYAKNGHLIIDEEGLRLTEKGIDISNAIMSLFV